MDKDVYAQTERAEGCALHVEFLAEAVVDCWREPARFFTELGHGSEFAWSPGDDGFLFAFGGLCKRVCVCVCVSVLVSYASLFKVRHWVTKNIRP